MDLGGVSINRDALNVSCAPAQNEGSGGMFQKRLAKNLVMALANKRMFQTENRVSESILYE